MGYEEFKTFVFNCNFKSGQNVQADISPRLEDVRQTSHLLKIIFLWVLVDGSLLFSFLFMFYFLLCILAFFLLYFISYTFSSAFFALRGFI